MNVEHDTVNKQMVHDFGNGCKLVTDQRTETAYMMKDRDVKDQFSVKYMTVPEYTERVFAIAHSLKEKPLKP